MLLALASLLGILVLGASSSHWTPEQGTPGVLVVNVGDACGLEPLQIASDPAPEAAASSGFDYLVQQVRHARRLLFAPRFEKRARQRQVKCAPGLMCTPVHGPVRIMHPASVNPRKPLAGLCVEEVGKAAPPRAQGYMAHCDAEHTCQAPLECTPDCQCDAVYLHGPRETHAQPHLGQVRDACGIALAWDAGEERNRISVWICDFGLECVFPMANTGVSVCLPARRSLSKVEPKSAPSASASHQAIANARRISVRGPLSRAWTMPVWRPDILEPTPSQTAFS
jgi:hypothetical protein